MSAFRLSPTWGLVVAALVLALVPALKLPAFYESFLYLVFFWISLATSWNILSGYAGYFSFGHAAFFGAGVYTTATLTTAFNVPFLLTLTYGLGCALGGHDAAGVPPQVSRLARRPSGAEVERLVHPDAPHRYRMRPPVGAHRDQPVVVRPPEPPLGPRPGQHPLRVRRNAVARHVRTRGPRAVAATGILASS